MRLAAQFFHSPASNPDPAGPSRDAGMREAAHGEQEQELGQVLQGVLVRPLDAVEYLDTRQRSKIDYDSWRKSSVPDP